MDETSRASTRLPRRATLVPGARSLDRRAGLDAIRVRPISEACLCVHQHVTSYSCAIWHDRLLSDHDQPSGEHLWVRAIWRTRQFTYTDFRIAADVYLFVNDGVINDRACTNDRIKHHNAVAHNRTRADMYTWG